MKALSLIALVIAGFLIFIGITSRVTSGVLGDAVTFLGGLMLVFLVLIWILALVKKKKEAKNTIDFGDSE